MQNTSGVEQNIGGILIRVAGNLELASTRQNFLDHAARLGIDQLIETTVESDTHAIRFRLLPALQQELAPDCDTLQLCEKLDLHTLDKPADLEKEILLAMLLGPVAFEYPVIQNSPLRYAFVKTSWKPRAVRRSPSMSAKSNVRQITGAIPK